MSLVLLFTPVVAPAHAGDDATIPDLAAELRGAYYNDRVLEICGLYTGEVYDGFLRRVRYLVTAGGIDAETNRRIKISGWTEADYQYDDHGLGGFRHWCATDGQRAVAEFLEFRRRELADHER